ncbi:hypothetical protein [Methylobacterium sp. Leaf118]|uniref:hypothetical protein n=1 Tax=Methylobacterium sp. Leaf118 TaxID=2876562 RepID=UPI001E3A9E85|nr:hypothetical protein [Methylobacterium sp. Leaf118]
MKKFISARPEAGASGFGSQYDPVLAGVAQGLARLFPPLDGTRPASPGRPAEADDGSAATAQAGGATEAGARG